MTEIFIFAQAGSFAENKDIAKEIRTKQITPALKSKSGEVILDFDQVTGATQSFIHALLSQVIRDYGDLVFTRLLFRNCNEAIQEVVNIVADYMSEA